MYIFFTPFKCADYKIYSLTLPKTLWCKRNGVRFQMCIFFLIFLTSPKANLNRTGKKKPTVTLCFFRIFRGVVFVHIKAKTSESDLESSSNLT